MKALADLMTSEIAAAHAAMDRKEAELDAYGYGGAPACRSPKGCRYSRTLNQPYPRACVQCGVIEQR